MSEVSAATVNFGGHFHGSLIDMILDAGVIVQFVLLFLLFFSVLSWAIIFMKYLAIRKARRENVSFSEVYMRSTKLSEVFTASKKFTYSPVAEVFRTGYAEQVNLNKLMKDSPAASEGSAVSASEMKGVDNVERALNRACSAELTKLESTLGFLATTGSVSPFIGLFGTVWGIMDTFRGIGAKGSATLAVVAPGISEALVATAAGLAAAISAVVFYNYFQNNLKTMAIEMVSFASELLNIIERHYVRR
ncbi:MAG TPA: protein TolQ [Syntrophales bacterium]|nr:protein TolQ [Syntrophales bacterium]